MRQSKFDHVGWKHDQIVQHVDTSKYYTSNKKQNGN